MGRSLRCLIAYPWILAFVACASEPPRQVVPRYFVDYRVRAPDDTLLMPFAPGEIRSEEIFPESLRVNLTISLPELGDIADVAETADGRILVLNRQDGFIIALDSLGQVVDTLSRRGDGPGELNLPYAMAALRNEAIVLQAVAPGNTLSRIPLDGGTKDGRSPPIEGDWGMFSQRGPNVLLNFPVQSGIEDWTRRLGTDSDSTFLVEVRVPEGEGAPGDGVPPQERSVLLRFTADLQLLDTIWSAPSAPARYATDGGAGAPPRLIEPLFVSRPAWTAGDGWFAFAHGDSTHIKVTRTGGGKDLIVIWPPGRSALSEDNRLAAAHWARVYTGRSNPMAREQFAKMKEAQLLEAERMYLDFLAFADSTPLVTALFGNGQCLWSANFDARSFFDGTGLVLAGVNVEKPSELITFRIPGDDVRIMHISGRWAYVKTFDEDDSPQLLRYKLPRRMCG